MTIIAAFTASSDPLMEKVKLSKLTSAPELEQMSDSIVRTSAGDGVRSPPCEGSGTVIHHDAL